MKRLAMAILMLALTACGDDADDTNPGDAAMPGSGGDGQSGSGGSGASGSGGGSGGSGSSGKGASGSGGNGSAEEDGGAAGSGGSAPAGKTTCKAPVEADSAGNDCPDDDPVALKATLVADGFDVPVFAAHAPGDDRHLYVVERGGTIQRLDLETGETSEFLDLGDRVVAASSADGELGLLGMTFHPDFPDDPRFFLNYTTDPVENGFTALTHISSFLVDGDEGDPNSEEVLFDYDQPQSNHNGGMLAFGPDGCLFVAAGDGGNSNDVGSGHAEGGNGQSLDTALGKILRLDVDAPKKAAPGNLGMDALAQIWDYGVRNPWRFSFDRKTGDLYIGDVGQGAHEEVDVEKKGDGHHNYGWPIMEGFDCLSGGSCEMDGLTLPVTAYDHVDGQVNSITGGYVYRGKKIDSLDGWYLYADHGPAHKIWTFVWDGEGTCKDPIDLSTRDAISVDSGITSFGEDLDGEIYLTTHTSVYRIDEK
jgi:glucose/arabinose dehydrogenase